MIYLIDDKKERQEKDYNWSSNKIKSYCEILQPIYNLEELQKNRDKIFKESRIILYHESFIDKSILSDVAAQKRKELTEFAERENKYLVYFSGGNDTRQIDGNIAYISDATLYQNLEFFLKAYKNEDFNFGYLVYGADPKLEEKLKNKQLELIKETEKEEVKEVKGKQNLFLRPSDDFISNPILNIKKETLWEASDNYLNEFVEEKLNDEKYDNLFIPLCFGDTLSDFNGLKLAIHVRCSKSLNQCTNIFIYSFVKSGYLVNHLYFDVLKTKNVKLIEFSKEEIFSAANSNKVKLSNVELTQEISKIKLNPPKDYHDNHSIANEWAIYRWSKTLNVPDVDRNKKIENRVECSLYFKYLKTIYPIAESSIISQNNLRIKYSRKPRVLYIDDEAEKGWGEIFDFIFYQNKEIYFDYLLEDFKSINQEDLIKAALQKIEVDEIDLVLLDFRLIPADFNTNNIEYITGVRLLNKIKESNPGIQVIIFSATNKIWNLQKLQEAGADGFILKESPENSLDESFTMSSVENLIQTINKCFEHIFLKDFYTKIKELRADLIPRKNYRIASNPLDANFVDEVLKWLELSCQLLSKNIDTASKTSSFLFIFSVLENLSNQIVSSDSIRVNFREGHHYEFEFARVSKRLFYFSWDKETGLYSKTNNKLKLAKAGIPWAQKILNTLDYLNSNLEDELDLNEVIGKRNDIIHANSTLNAKLEVSNLEIINLFNTVYKGLKMI